MNWFRKARIIVAASSLVLAPLTARAADVTVFAAASLTDALNDVGKASTRPRPAMTP